MTMGFTVDAFNLAKSQMLSDFNKALADAEALGGAGTEGVAKHSAAPTVEDTSRIAAASPQA
jgi:hypothetical protein